MGAAPLGPILGLSIQSMGEILRSVPTRHVLVCLHVLDPAHANYLCPIGDCSKGSQTLNAWLLVVCHLCHGV